MAHLSAIRANMTQWSSESGETPTVAGSGESFACRAVRLCGVELGESFACGAASPCWVELGESFAGVAARLSRGGRGWGSPLPVRRQGGGWCKRGLCEDSEATRNILTRCSTAPSWSVDGPGGVSSAAARGVLRRRGDGIGRSPGVFSAYCRALHMREALGLRGGEIGHSPGVSSACCGTLCRCVGGIGRSPGVSSACCRALHLREALPCGEMG